jgi:hypothetical protein
MEVSKPARDPWRKKEKEEKEVFRITPEWTKYYAWAEYTRKIGNYPNEKYFAPSTIYVGQLFKRDEGGFGDGSWRRDTFIYHDKTVVVNYSYEGHTCFIEVPEKEKLKLAKLGVLFHNHFLRIVKKYPNMTRVIGIEHLNRLIQTFLN